MDERATFAERIAALEPWDAVLVAPDVYAVRFNFPGTPTHGKYFAWRRDPDYDWVALGFLDHDGSWRPDRDPACWFDTAEEMADHLYVALLELGEAE